MYQTLRRIVRIGIKTEDAPAPATEDVVVARLQEGSSNNSSAGCK